MILNSKKLIGVLVVAVLVLGVAGIALADPVTITGTINETDGRYVLEAGGKKVILDTNVEQSLLGRPVSVTGTLQTDDSGNEVMMDIEHIQNKRDLTDHPQWQ
jgi:hypothetical protein